VILPADVRNIRDAENAEDVAALLFWRSWRPELSLPVAEGDRRAGIRADQGGHGIPSLLLRGLAKVRSEWRLVAAAHNRKLITAAAA
jgi:hypothetical protein